MRGMTAWTLVVILAVFALSTGCEDKNKEVAQAPAQEPVQKFPEATVPPPEPQPAPTATNAPPPPPVDTTAEKPAAKSSHKSKQQPTSATKRSAGPGNRPQPGSRRGPRLAKAIVPEHRGPS